MLQFRLAGVQLGELIAKSLDAGGADLLWQGLLLEGLQAAGDGVVGAALVGADGASSA
jgi:hypothetical protein